MTGLPSGVVTAGRGCSAGEGKASVITSSSSSMPIRCGEETASTGWKLPRATAFSRSSMSTLGSISSPDRYLSIRPSSSLSWMMPSISSPRSSSIRSASAAEGAPSARFPPE